MGVEEFVRVRLGEEEGGGCDWDVKCIKKLLQKKKKKSPSSRLPDWNMPGTDLELLEHLRGPALQGMAVEAHDGARGLRTTVHEWTTPTSTFPRPVLALQPPAVIGCEDAGSHGGVAGTTRPQ